MVTGEGGEPACSTPEALLAAEAESILRDSGMSVRSVLPLTGVELAIRVVSLAASGQRCVSTLYMSLSLDRYLESSDAAGPDYFGSIVVTDGLVVLTHPAASHRDVLRRRVNEYVTVWSNELVRNRPVGSRPVFRVTAGPRLLALCVNCPAWLEGYDGVRDGDGRLSRPLHSEVCGGDTPMSTTLRILPDPWRGARARSATTRAPGMTFSRCSRPSKRSRFGPLRRRYRIRACGWSPASLSLLGTARCRLAWYRIATRSSNIATSRGGAGKDSCALAPMRHT